MRRSASTAVGRSPLNFNTANASDYTQGLSFTPGASVVFADGQAGQALAINGNSYTLLRSMADVDGIDGMPASGNLINASAARLSGHYALAKNLDAAGTTYANALINSDGNTTQFTGVFEGLGHTISNLAISSQGINDGYTFSLANASLFTSIGAAGVVRDLGLNAVDMRASGATFYIGALATLNQGMVNQVYSTGSILTAGDDSAIPYIGGLVGSSTGTIALSYSTASVNVANYAAYAGGLVGQSNGPNNLIVRSYATGTVTNNVGGYAGGLVGNFGGGSGATGRILDSYARGAVTGGSGVYTGALVGNLSQYTFIGNSYATGQVSGTGAIKGGVAGRVNTQSTASRNPQLQNVYWDNQSTQQSAAFGSLGNFPNAFMATGYTGLTTAQLQSGTLPTGFDESIWTAAAGFYPVLTPAYSQGFGAAAMQVISGTAYQSVGGAVASGASIGLFNNGSLLSGNPVTTDATGAYKALVPNSTLSGTFALGQTITLSGANAISGAAYDDTLTTNAAGNVTGLTIASGVSTFQDQHDKLFGTQRSGRHHLWRCQQRTPVLARIDPGRDRHQAAFQLHDRSGGHGRQLVQAHRRLSGGDQCGDHRGRRGAGHVGRRADHRSGRLGHVLRDRRRHRARRQL